MIVSEFPKVELLNCDCMEFMKGVEDKKFDLAIVDVPYGIGEGGNNISRHHSQKKYKASNWDEYSPNQEYFNELIRVSKNQIVWGANHFISKIPYDSSCWIVWDKDRYGDFADGEVAWTSFKTALRIFKFTWDGFRKQKQLIAQERIHPTEKPIELYRWLLSNYATGGGQDTRHSSWKWLFGYCSLSDGLRFYWNGNRQGLLRCLDKAFQASYKSNYNVQ